MPWGLLVTGTTLAEPSIKDSCGQSLFDNKASCILLEELTIFLLKINLALQSPILEIATVLNCYTSMIDGF